MDLELTEPQRGARDVARRFAREKLGPIGVEADRSHRYPAEAIDELARLNADLAVPGPRAYGIDEGRWSALLPLMAEQALGSGSPGNNPRVPTKQEIVALYQQVWG